MSILDTINWSTLLQAILPNGGGNRFITLWCGGISLYFLCCLFFLARGVAPMRGALRRATRGVEKLDGEEGFTANFETYDHRVRADRRLTHVWSEFVESLVFPAPGDDVASIRNTTDVAHFLNDGTVIQPVVHTRFFNSVPSHLTGAGILGTFVGLAAGIAGATHGLTQQDPGEITKALGRLLDGASLAFLTSIFGLSSSLLFLLIERYQVTRLHGALEGWVSALESHLQLVTSERIGLDQLRFAKEQTKQLQAFNSELIFSLEQALEERVAARLAPHLERMVEVIEGLRADRSTDTTHVIEEMIGRFTTTLTERTGTEFESISTTVRDLDTTLKASVLAMKETNREVGERLGSMMTSIENVLGAATNALQRDLAETMEGVRGGFSDSSQQFSDHLAEAGSRVADTVREAIETASRQLAERSTAAAGEIAGSMSNTTRDLSQAMESVRATIHESSEELAVHLGVAGADAAEKLRGAIHGASQELVDSGHEAALKIAASLSGFERGVGKLEETLTVSRALLSNLGTFIDRIDGLTQTLGDTHQRVGAIAEGMKAAADGIQTSSDRVAHAVEGTTDVVRQVTQAAAQMSQYQEALTSTWQGYQQRFEGIDGALQIVFQNIDEGLGRYTEQVKTFVTELDQKTAATIQNLAAATHELRQTLEDLEDLLGRLNKG